MCYRLFSLLKFWIVSTNQHGVHSPFVYGYVTEGLYGGRDYNTTKSLNILFKTIAYFKLSQLQIRHDHIGMEKELDKKICITDSSNELIFTGQLDQETIDRLLVQNKNITNNTMVYIEGIYNTPNTTKLWKSVMELEQVTVTIDLFYGGLVFFRKEQVKEHFKIRI